MRPVEPICSSSKMNCLTIESLHYYETCGTYLAPIVKLNKMTIIEISLSSTRCSMWQQFNQGNHPSLSILASFITCKISVSVLGSILTC